MSPFKTEYAISCYNGQQVNNAIKTFSPIYLMMNCMIILITFGLGILILTTRMILSNVMNLSGEARILVMLILICGIKNTLYHEPKFLVFKFVD